VERPPDQHLTFCELALLASVRESDQAYQRVFDPQWKQHEEHLLACSECQELLYQEQFLLRMSKQPPITHRSELHLGCPSEQQWMEFAAGLQTLERSKAQFEHATNCALCCARLKRISEQFADENTEEELRVLGSLASTDPDWQKTLAGHMQELSCVQSLRPSEKKRRFKPSLLPPLALALGSAAVLVVVAWWFTYSRPTRAVNRLLSAAYSEQRTSELRMADAAYSPVQTLRGETSETRPPTSLFDAEAMIAKELASKPDDPFWLDAQGRADLINDNYSLALSSLEGAERYRPEDHAIRIDLASAYFLRAEVLKRSEDYGRAADLLGEVLSKDPRNSLARFNRAIVSERLFLYEQARDDWRHYLEIDSGSPWSEEARKHLRDLQEKIQLHKERGETHLLSPSDFLASLRDNRGSSAKEVDLLTERYFDLALREWLLEAFSNTKRVNADSARTALSNLAQILISDHGDYWLYDFLEDLSRRSDAQEGLQMLDDFFRFEQTGDLDRAHKASVDAALAFHKVGNRPGELLAKFESSYADQLAHQVSSCRAEAHDRDDLHILHRYPWLRTQFDLESAACLNLNDEAARDLSTEALSLARLHHYPTLELRATAFLAELYQYMGDTSSAWKYSTEGLARFWQGGYPSMRGYSLYVGVNMVSEDAELWHLDAQILEEAANYIANDPDLELRAMEKYRLANALAMAGDFTDADQTLQEARALFLHSPQGARKNNLEMEAQIVLARSDLLRSRPRMSIDRLEPLSGKIREISDEDLVFEYFSDLGLAYFAVGAPSEARRALEKALVLEEQSIQKNDNERERLIWSRKADRVYRAMVQLNASISPGAAFSEWESFKGASVRFTPETPPTPDPTRLRQTYARRPSFPIPQSTVLISYAVLPEGTFAWVYDGLNIRQFELPISAPEIELLGRRFADDCSRPDSPLPTVLARSRALYQKLVEPMEPVLRSYKHLVIEPDRALWLVPFAALEDQNAVFLGDRYAISFSPGLDYLAASAPWTGVSPVSPILIAGDPEMRNAKPLDEAAEEAKGIARQFRYNQLLLKGDAGSKRISVLLRDAEVFHFSGHAAASPGGVGLLLGDSTVMNVAKIRASDFSHLRLAVLSACNSANGGTDVFDDRDSLARLLVGAGVVDVVASRWRVNSRATAKLMQEFYAQLLSGKDVSSALGEASRQLRSSGEFAHPFYWASFSAFGKS
jgi:CHAT domain-containing protein/cytochrome c-type biogenesis protein CcmH/NrfG